MKPASWFLFLFAGFLCSAPAGRSQFKVTAATLGEWKTTGFNESAKSDSPALSLPAGATISRGFAGGMIVVRVISRPYFVSNNSDWPILMVGPAALVFRRDGVLGQLVLANPDGTLQTVAGSVSLDKAGLSRELLDVLVAYDPGSRIGIVGFGNELRSFLNGDAATGEVVLSAGSNHPWAWDSLEVDVLDQGQKVDGPGSHDAAIPSPVYEPGESVKTFSAVKQFLARQNLAAMPAALPKAEVSVAKSVNRPKPGLEVFTPPAVRFVNADAVRALVAKSAGK